MSQGSSKTDYDSADYMFNPDYAKDLVDEEDNDTALGTTEAKVDIIIN